MNAAPQTTLVDLIRHGETVGGARYRGSTDDALTARGWEQMWNVVGSGSSWDRVISSPLVRCVEFARELAGRHSFPVAIDKRLRELHFGEWEGRSAAQLLATEPYAVSQFWNDPTSHSPPGGEPLVTFQARVLAAWDELARRYRGEHLLIVTHGGPIRVILAHVLEMPPHALPRFELKHASVSRVRVSMDGSGCHHPSLVFHAGRL